MKYLYFLTFIILIGISGLQAQKAITVESILFEHDKANLTENTKLQLDEILTINDIDSIQLTGHTDSDGNHDYNLILSQKRVFAVQNHLVQHGFPNDKIIVNHHGDNIPLSDNDSENGKQQNRRVEITVFFKPEPIITKIAIKEEPEIVEIPAIDTIETIVEIIEDTTINIGGIKVTLAKNDFYAYDGMPVFEPILTVTDAMKHGLTTMTTSGALLVSDGMIKVNPLPYGNCFTKPIKVYFPANLANVVGGKRKHYILRNKGWKVGGRKRSIEIVQLDNVSYYEMTIACYLSGYQYGNGGYHNCDGGIIGSKHKLKLPAGYKLHSMSIQYSQPLAIYAFNNNNKRRKLLSRPRYSKSNIKRKTKFSLPCRLPHNSANVTVKVYHTRTNKTITKQIPFGELKTSMLKSKCSSKRAIKGLRAKNKNRKQRPAKKFSVKRKFLKA